jgi:hypothetical protein
MLSSLLADEHGNASMQRLTALADARDKASLDLDDLLLRISAARTTRTNASRASIPVMEDKWPVLWNMYNELERQLREARLSAGAAAATFGRFVTPRRDTMRLVTRAATIPKKIVTTRSLELRTSALLRKVVSHASAVDQSTGGGSTRHGATAPMDSFATSSASTAVVAPIHMLQSEQENNSVAGASASASAAVITPPVLGPSPMKDASDQEYEVETILASREESGILFFRVRWLGYSDECDTWEPASECRQTCPERVREFEEGQGVHAPPPPASSHGVEKVNAPVQLPAVLTALSETLFPPDSATVEAWRIAIHGLADKRDAAYKQWWELTEQRRQTRSRGIDAPWMDDAVVVALSALQQARNELAAGRDAIRDKMPCIGRREIPGGGLPRTPEQEDLLRVARRAKSDTATAELVRLADNRDFVSLQLDVLLMVIGECRAVGDERDQQLNELLKLWPEMWIALQKTIAELKAARHRLHRSVTCFGRAQPLRFPHMNGVARRQIPPSTMAKVKTLESATIMTKQAEITHVLDRCTLDHFSLLPGRFLECVGARAELKHLKSLAASPEGGPQPTYAIDVVNAEALYAIGMPELLAPAAASCSMVTDVQASVVPADDDILHRVQIPLGVHPRMAASAMSEAPILPAMSASAQSVADGFNEPMFVADPGFIARATHWKGGVHTTIERKEAGVFLSKGYTFMGIAHACELPHRWLNGLTGNPHDVAVFIDPRWKVNDEGIDMEIE